MPTRKTAAATTQQPKSSATYPAALEAPRGISRAMTMPAPSSTPVRVGTFNSVERPNASPPILPTRNAPPPSAASRATTYPRYGQSLPAISGARIPDATTVCQMWSCVTISMMITQRMTGVSLSWNSAEKVTVCVRKPGPTADVAIRNAALRSAAFCCLDNFISHALYSKSLASEENVQRLMGHNRDILFRIPVHEDKICRQPLCD